MSWRLLGFLSFLSTETSPSSHTALIFLVLVTDTLVFLKCDAFCTATCDTTSTCGRVMRARRYHALPQDRLSRGDLCLYPTRSPMNFPREIGSKIKTSFVGYCSLGFLVFAFHALSRPSLWLTLNWCCSINVCTASTDLARKDPPEIRFSTTSTLRKIRFPRVNKI